MSQSDVRLRGIQKSYGKVHVIHGVDLDIEPGEFTVYMTYWAPLYEEGLSPRQAWQRALDGFAQGA